jgi:ornithine--oxo-acid transaminase
MLSSQELISLEQRYGAQNYSPLPVVLSHGKGIYVWDPEGKRYLDFLSGICAVSQGHCHPKILETLKSQAEQLPSSPAPFTARRSAPSRNTSRTTSATTGSLR